MIGGTPFADHPEDECFPSALLNLPDEQELLGVNINEMGRDAAAIKVIARMFGLKFDTLWQRLEREKKRKRNLLIAAALFFVMTVVGVAGWIWHQNQELKEKNHQVLLEKSRFIAETASRLADNGENYLARLLALEVLLNNPYTPEAEQALRKAWQGEGTTLSDSIGAGTAIVSPDGKWVAASCFEIVRLWDSNSGLLIFALPMGEEQVTDLAFSSDGKILQTTDINGFVRQWSIPEGKERKKLVDIPLHDDQIAEVFEENAPVADDGAVSADFNSDSSLIAVAYRLGYVRVWDVATRECVYEYDAEDVDAWSVDFFPDNKRLLVSTDHSVRICDLPLNPSYISLNTSDNFYTPMWNLVFTPDSKCLISVSGDMIIRCWNVITGKKMWQKDTSQLFKDDYVLPGSIVFQESGSVIRFDYDGGTYLMLNAADGHVRNVKKGSAFGDDDSQLGNTEAISPDGKTKAVVFDNFNVAIYKTETNEVIWRLHTADPHDVHALVATVVYSPDNQLIAVGSQDGDLRIYRFPPLQELINETRERFKNRPLTPEERRKYYLE